MSNLDNSKLIKFLSEQLDCLKLNQYKNNFTQNCIQIAVITGQIHLLTKGLCFDEAVVVNWVLKGILKTGNTICIHNTKDWIIENSADHIAIATALNSTGEDTLQIRDHKGNPLGYIHLVYGQGTAEECIAEYCTNEFTEAIVAPIIQRYESL